MQSLLEAASYSDPEVAREGLNEYFSEKDFTYSTA
jgi:hypothetical protein